MLPLDIVTIAVDEFLFHYLFGWIQVWVFQCNNKNHQDSICLLESCYTLAGRSATRSYRVFKDFSPWVGDTSTSGEEFTPSPVHLEKLAQLNRRVAGSIIWLTQHVRRLDGLNKVKCIGAIFQGSVSKFKLLFCDLHIMVHIVYSEDVIFTLLTHGISTHVITGLHIDRRLGRHSGDGIDGKRIVIKLEDSVCHSQRADGFCQ
mmetsp:Transcript_10047/g.11466  ORF Transcript_10047/g.11466 Transcript_10047/m.11466 type:complete len:203 (-) Transcript_10047:975-1583(-)